MADEEEEIKEQEESKTEDGEKRSLISRLLPTLILVVIVAVSAGSGFGLGRLFAKSRTPETAESDSQADKSADTNGPVGDEDLTGDSENVWYYDLDPVVASLNEPSVTRYVRASLTLQMSGELDQDKGVELLDQKKPLLVNWLTVYLSGLGLEEIRGDKNLRAIQSKIRESLNDQLFPDSKPLIKQVLIKEFPVQ